LSAASNGKRWAKIVWRNNVAANISERKMAAAKMAMWQSSWWRYRQRKAIINGAVLCGENLAMAGVKWRNGGKRK